MINSQNVQDYIAYLYKRKTGNEIPNDVLSSWSGLEDDEITHHLTELYTSWHIGSNDARMMENEFLTKIDKPRPEIADLQQARGLSGVPATKAASDPESLTGKQPGNKNRRPNPWYWFVPIAIILVIGTAYVTKNYELYNPFASSDTTGIADQPSIDSTPIVQDTVMPEPPPPAAINPPAPEQDPPVKLGTVAVSTKAFLGTKSRDRIIKQLEKKARKLYPGYSRLENTRYEGDNATADVMIDP